MIKISYAGYRFPFVIIQQAIWLYLRFTLSFRDVEDLLAERGMIVSYETVHRWVNHFGPRIAPIYASVDQSSILLGIWTRSISRSMVGWSNYGGRWTPRARRQTFWSRVGETSMQR
jgi:hypothetical protein